MAKHRGTPEREVSMMVGRAVLTLDPHDLPLIEKLLMNYAHDVYFADTPRARDLRGYRMRPDEARALALKVRRLRRG